MFAASLHSICPVPGLGFILCYICAVLSIELFVCTFSSFDFSFFVVSFNFKDWGYMEDSQGVRGSGNRNGIGIGIGIGKAKRDMAGVGFCLFLLVCLVFAWLWLIEGPLVALFVSIPFQFCSMKKMFQCLKFELRLSK